MGFIFGITNEELTELIKKIHDNAVAHGWWDTNRDMDEVLFLIECELAEAVEAYRRDKLFEQCDKDIGLDNLAEELADVLIRLFDWCGQMGVTVIPVDEGMPGELPKVDSFVGYCRKIAKAVNLLPSNQELNEGCVRWSQLQVRAIVAMVKELSDRKSVYDIWYAVRQKHAYNVTRPYRHGNLKA